MAEGSPGRSKKTPRRFSQKGDTGYTSLLGAPSDPVNRYRVPKYHPQPHAYGVVDEASAVLSMARNSSPNQKVRQVIYSIQEDLVVLMAELATAAEAGGASGYRVTPAHVRRLEELLEGLQQEIELPARFVISSSSLAAATLDLGRTVVRRAEREAARLRHENIIGNDEVLKYLNRCADLLWTLARYEEAVGGAGRSPE